jgi:hypothetical protein
MPHNEQRRIMAIHGSITLNGISDRELGKIWEFKAKDGNKFNFQPNALQPVLVNGVQQGTYNNVTFTWTDEVGFKVVHEIVGYLLKKDEQATAVNQ